MLGYVWKRAMEVVGASRKVFELIDREPKIRNDGYIVRDTLRGKIEFRNVEFNYPSRPQVPVLCVIF